jgi:hypothetical protein
MALENHSLGSEAQVQEQERLTEDLLRGSPARLWDEES